jgi:hypothetical protein
LNCITKNIASKDITVSNNFNACIASIEREIEKGGKNEVKRIREELSGNKNSSLFMSMLQTTRNIVYFSKQVVRGLI